MNSIQRADQCRTSFVWSPTVLDWGDHQQRGVHKTESNIQGVWTWPSEASLLEMVGSFPSYRRTMISTFSHALGIFLEAIPSLNIFNQPCKFPLIKMFCLFDKDVFRYDFFKALIAIITSVMVTGHVNILVSEMISTAVHEKLMGNLIGSD